MSNVKQAVGVNGHFVGSAYPDPGGAHYSTDHATVIGQDAAVTGVDKLDSGSGGEMCSICVVHRAFRLRNECEGGLALHIKNPFSWRQRNSRTK